MKLVCKKTCQIRVDEKITFVTKGDVIELAKEPVNGCFVAMESPKYEIDFLKASENELKKAKWAYKDAAKAIKDAYGVVIEQEEGDKKSDAIEQILDARFRAVN